MIKLRKYDEWASALKSFLRFDAKVYNCFARTMRFYSITARMAPRSEKDWTYFNTFALNAAAGNLICGYLGLCLSMLGAKWAIVKVNGIRGRENS